MTPAFWGATLNKPGQVSTHEKDIRDSVASSAWQWPNLAWGFLHECRFDFNRKAASFKFMQQGSRPKRTWRWRCFLSSLITPCCLWYHIKQMLLQVGVQYPLSSRVKAKTANAPRMSLAKKLLSGDSFLSRLITSWKWTTTLKLRRRWLRCNPNVSCPYAETYLHQIIHGHL